MTTNQTSPSTTATYERGAGEETYLVREAVAAFRNEAGLEQAILALQENGFDRARLSVLGKLEHTDRHSGWLRRMTAGDRDGRLAVSGRETLAEAQGAAFALPLYGGAVLGLMVVTAAGGALGLALAGMLAGGTIGGGAGSALSRAIGRNHEDAVQAQLAEGGMLLWVMLDPDAADEEPRAMRLLGEAGGERIHAVETRHQWGIDEVPLSRVNPDPFLEDPLAERP